MDFGWYGNEDTTAAVSFLQAQPDVDDERIAAVGMSMGGEEVIGAAAADSRIRAVVAEGATNRVTGDKAWLSDEFGWRGAVQERVEWLLYSTTDLLTDAAPPMTLRDAVAAASPRPVLLIAGGDVADEGRAGRYIQRGRRTQWSCGSSLRRDTRAHSAPIPSSGSSVSPRSSPTCSAKEMTSRHDRVRTCSANSRS